jgi:hypothetical protein
MAKRTKTTFIIYIGLPCSGKTMAAQAALKLKKNSKALFLDDWSHNFLDGVNQFMNKKPAIVISTDSRMCGVPEQKIKEIINLHCVDDMEHIFEFIYFENDAEQCLNNIQNSSNKKAGIAPFIKHWTKNYKIPYGAKKLPVWKDE